MTTERDVRHAEKGIEDLIKDCTFVLEGALEPKRENLALSRIREVRTEREFSETEWSRIEDFVAGANHQVEVLRTFFPHGILAKDPPA